MKNSLNILEEFPKKKVAVIGDIITDHYLFGEWGKNSPEAPFRIVSVKGEKFVPGGAGNTAVNVAGLGSGAYLIGQIGKDEIGLKVYRALLFLNKNVYPQGVLKSALCRTSEKLRILVDGVQVVRADTEEIFSHEEDSEDKTIEFILQNVENFDAILVSDYAKGFVTENIAKEVLRIAKEWNKIVVVDTKPKHFEWFKGCYCIKPNKVEAEKFTGIKIEDLKDAERAGQKIKKDLETNVLLTLDSMGMILFEEECTTLFSSLAKDVFDVTGVGDTVLATFSLALVAGASMKDAAALASRSASIVIAKSGTAHVSLEELKKSIS